MAKSINNWALWLKKFPFFHTIPILTSIGGSRGIPLYCLKRGSISEKRKQPQLPLSMNFKVVYNWLLRITILGLIFNWSNRFFKSSFCTESTLNISRFSSLKSPIVIHFFLAIGCFLETTYISCSFARMQLSNLSILNCSILTIARSSFSSCTRLHARTEPNSSSSVWISGWFCSNALSTSGKKMVLNIGGIPILRIGIRLPNSKNSFCSSVLCFSRSLAFS